QDELLILTALNDVGDCGMFVGRFRPAVLLLSHVHGRSADAFYAPSRLVPVLTQPWTPELGLDALRRSVPAVGEPSDVIELARSPNRISAKRTFASRRVRRRSIHRTFCSSVTSLAELARDIG